MLTDYPPIPRSRDQARSTPCCWGSSSLSPTLLLEGMGQWAHLEGASTIWMKGPGFLCIPTKRWMLLPLLPGAALLEAAIGWLFLLFLLVQPTRRWRKLWHLLYMPQFSPRSGGVYGLTFPLFPLLLSLLNMMGASCSLHKIA